MNTHLHPAQASMVSEAASEQGSGQALDRLINREEILQICFWYQGEGLGQVFNAATLEPFLHNTPKVIDRAMADLQERGLLEAVAGGYRLTEDGRREGGRLFAESFADFQRPSHGECEAGCCEDDDHSQCGDDCQFH